ncbi:protein PERCC1 [Oryzias melastigma]|uniref:protein PERCC1 n=1 Tax=Oryzias melastigma TaxID=30732 RepID=UPI00168D7F5F|nr:protein PERCC1 [Oryzias melastigma]
MAAGVMENFLIQDPTPNYFPMFFQHSPCREDEEETLEGISEEREDEEDREDEEEDEDCDAPEDEEECLGGFLPNSADPVLDMTKQLLRFADLISHDVQRYFGRCSEDRQVCDIYNDSVSITTSGRLRYYDDLLKIARAESPKIQDCVSAGSAKEPGVAFASGSSGLGPLAELFDHRGLSQNRGQPMIKRHLPLSFWTEPVPHGSLVDFRNGSDLSPTSCDAHPQDGVHVSKHVNYSLLMHSNMQTLSSIQPDFSDLLANWDPNLEFTHTLTEDTHMQH